VETDVEILAIVEKPDVAAWLAEMGETEWEKFPCQKWKTIYRNIW
jgi:hypothetical protein